jgi:FkbM family methyltransferase
MIYKGIDIGHPGKSADKFVVDEIPGYFKCIDVKGQSVVDIGAHYGSFTVQAYKLGARTVDSYEPNPDSFKLLTKNTCKLPGVVVHQVAVVHNNRSEVCLHAHRTYSAASTIVKIPRNSPRSWVVPCVNFEKLLEDIRPDVLKLDCEGTEYDLLLNCSLPKCVKQIVMEIHLGIKKHRERYTQLVDVFKKWDVVRAPKNSWNICLAAWRR